MKLSNMACQRAVPGRVALELRDVVLERRRQERARSIGEGRAGRELRVQVLEPASVEVLLQLGVRGRARPQGMPGGQHLVREARRSEAVGRLDAASEPVLALEHADVPAVPGEERGARERVDAGADEDHVESRHGATLSPTLPA
jgi:hypothetical protein